MKFSADISSNNPALQNKLSNLITAGLALCCLPFISERLPDLDNLKSPVKAGDIIRVSSQPELFDEFDHQGVPRCGVNIRNERQVLRFSDENGRRIEIPVDAIPDIEIGDQLKIIQLHADSFTGEISDQEAIQVVKVLP